MPSVSRSWRILALVITTWFISSCSGSDAGPTQPDPTPTLASITVSAPSAAPLTALGQTMRLTAQGRTDQGATVALSPSWTSSNPGVATVDATGLVTAVGDGSTQITATQSGVTGAAAVEVTQVPSRLAFEAQPLDGVAGRPFSESVVVHVLDANDALVVNHDDPVVLSLASGPSGSGLEGALSVAPVGGVATFDAVSPSAPGTDYVLRASSGTLSVDGQAFSVASGLTFENFPAAAFVLGQQTLTAGTRNAGGTGPNPVGVVFRGTVTEGAGRFYMVDGGNSRILGFNSVPTASGPSADFVLGQPDLFTTESASSILRTDSTFIFPGEVIASDGKLFVNDFNNSRILIWNTLPTTNMAPADVIVGQADFTSNNKATSRTAMQRPTHMAVADGRLIVTDNFANRVLIWNEIPTANGAPADVVVGQPDFTSDAAGIGPSSLSSPRGVWSDGTRLAVADGNNFRVLVWNRMPTTNGAPADVVLGAPDFTSPGSITASASSVGRPHDVVSDGEVLFVSDEENSRVLVFAFPGTSGASALGVLGQTDFTLSAGDDPDQDGVSEGVVSARTFGTDSPNNLELIGGRLYVSDVANHRVLVFDPR